jgi:pimeloyl-ACP methyl ester carboxylesterase
VIRLVRAGEDGPVVLLLHGIGGAAESFRPQLDALCADYRVLAWDAPGYGGSSDPDAAPGTAGFASAAAEVLADADAAHVVGVSWGGVIATRLAVECPELVRSLVLAGSTRGSGVTPAGADAMRSRPAELARLGAAEFARRRAPRLPGADADAHVRARIERIMAGVRLPGYRYAAEAMAETDHTPLLGRVSAPTLVLVGDQDQVTGPAESRRLADGIPGARLEIIESAGHAANQERPGAFNAAIAGFFAAVDGRVGGLR